MTPLYVMTTILFSFFMDTYDIDFDVPEYVVMIDGYYTCSLNILPDWRWTWCCRVKPFNNHSLMKQRHKLNI